MANFPAEWEDDNRMNFMFSAFPENRNVNPKHWDSKFQFWTSAIVESCDSLDELCFDINVLKSRFRRKGVTPLGLSTVVKEMLNIGQVVRMSDFLDSVYDTWSEWSYGIAKRSLWWTVGKVWQNDEIEGSLLLLASVKPSPSLVVTMSMLCCSGYVASNGFKDIESRICYGDKTAQKVLSCHYQSVKHSITDSIVPEKVLKTRLHANSIELSEQEFEIVICQLRKDRLVSVHMLENNEKVFKFANKNENKVVAIAETDLNILRLKKAEAMIQLQIKKLQSDINELQGIVVASVNQGLRNKAKKTLSRKHIMLNTLDKKESLLLNTQDILHRIQDAHSDANVIEALKAGAQVFKTISQESGFTLDNVEKIMDEVEEVIDETAEIDRTISEGSKTIAATSGVIDDDLEDLEKELEDLMMDDIIAANIAMGPDDKEKLAVKLPDVPSFNPGEEKKETRTALTS